MLGLIGGWLVFVVGMSGVGLLMNVVVFWYMMLLVLSDMNSMEFMWKLY